MTNDLRIYILAYPDNPVGYHFIRTFLQKGVSLSGVIIEKSAGGGIKARMRKKIEVDGIRRTMVRVFQVYLMRFLRRNIAAMAEKNGIDVLYVHRFNSEECRTLLSSLEADLLVIASAPILKPYVFEQARLGCLNAHPGWLPLYRGLGANAYALQQGHAPGITVHFIDAGVDTGRIIARETVPLRKRDTVAKINDRAVARGAVMITEAIERIRNGSLTFPEIDDPTGENYRSMPYRDVRQVNRRMPAIAKAAGKGTP